MRRLLKETTSNGDKTFPWKLHIMLERSEQEGFEKIVSWQGNCAFKVHEPALFERFVLKRFFNQTKYKSFTRQLNLYGFERVTTYGGNVDFGSYKHPCLIRGNTDACKYMIRGENKKKTSVPHQQRPRNGNRRSCNPREPPKVGSSSNIAIESHTTHPLRLHSGGNMNVEKPTARMKTKRTHVYHQQNHLHKNYGDQLKQYHNENVELYVLAEAILGNVLGSGYQNSSNKSHCTAWDSCYFSGYDVDILDPYDHLHMFDDTHGDIDMVENLLRVLNQNDCSTSTEFVNIFNSVRDS